MVTVSPVLPVVSGVLPVVFGQSLRYWMVAGFAFQMAYRSLPAGFITYWLTPFLPSPYAVPEPSLAVSQRTNVYPSRVKPLAFVVSSSPVLPDCAAVLPPVAPLP